MSVIDVAHLSPPERLALIGELWDSLADADVAMTPGQRSELQHRMARFDEERGSYLPWQEVYADLLNRPR